MLANHTSMRHFSHGFIKIKTISNNKHIGNNETTVVTLVTTTKRSVLLTQNASLVIIKKTKINTTTDSTPQPSSIGIRAFMVLPVSIISSTTITLRPLRDSRLTPSTRTTKSSTTINHTISCRLITIVTLNLYKIIGKEHLIGLEVTGQCRKESVGTLLITLKNE